MSDAPINPANLITVQQAAEQWDGFSESSLRALIARAENNGLRDAHAVIRLGRRVLIERERFGAWLALHCH